MIIMLLLVNSVVICLLSLLWHLLVFLPYRAMGDWVCFFAFLYRVTIILFSLVEENIIPNIIG